MLTLLDYGLAIEGGNGYTPEKFPEYLAIKSPIVATPEWITAPVKRGFRAMVLFNGSKVEIFTRNAKGFWAQGGGLIRMTA